MTKCKDKCLRTYNKYIMSKAHCFSNEFPYFFQHRENFAAFILPLRTSSFIEIITSQLKIGKQTSGAFHIHSDIQHTYF